MSISQDYIQLASEVDEAINLPRADAIYLPAVSDDDDYRDEFGFVMLEDGSCGPFYTSLPGELEHLHKRFGSGPLSPVDPMTLVQRMGRDSLIDRAVGLGAFNAISQHVLKQTLGDDWASAYGDRARVNVGGMEPEVGEWVGMVGYFCPVIDQLVDKGVNVLVLERQPGRVEQRPGVKLTESVADLATCRHILCTAATLVNDSLDEILDATGQCEQFNIIGPSGSGLPDVLFGRGVDAVGGVCFPSREKLMAQLAKGESWKSAGVKYQFDRETYPGLQALLARL